jgi:TonB family protein
MSATSSTFHSRLESDLRVDGIAVAGACLFHLLLVLVLVTPAMRHEAAVRTAMRFAVKGPNQYEEIRVLVIPYGDPGASAPRRLMGSVDAMSDARFKGKVEAARRVQARRERGQGGQSVIPSTGFDAFERLRILHGNLPTAQTEDIAAREIVKPEYPEDARNRGVEGTVVLVALVNEDGRVEDVALEAGVDPLLDQAAMRAAYLTPFFPYKIEGVAQAVFVRMPYHFELVGRLGN